MSIKLVPAEVQQHKHFWSTDLDQIADNALVTLQDRDVSLWVLAERRGKTVMQVRPVGVVYQSRCLGTQRLTHCGCQEMRSRGLAVGPRNDGYPLAGKQLTECSRVELEHDLAANRSPGTPPGQPGGGPGHAPGECRRREAG
jgi:hypothetical protein